MLETDRGGRRPGHPADHRAARRLADRRRTAAGPPQVVDVRPWSWRPGRAAVARGHGRRDRFVVEVDDDLPEIWADPDRLDQILANLIENAAAPRRRHACTVASGGAARRLAAATQPGGRPGRRATRARASRPSTASWCSPGSGRARAAAAPASGSTSCGASSRPTAAGSASDARPPSGGAALPLHAARRGARAPGLTRGPEARLLQRLGAQLERRRVEAAHGIGFGSVKAIAPRGWGRSPRRRRRSRSRACRCRSRRPPRCPSARVPEHPEHAVVEAPARLEVGAVDTEVIDHGRDATLSG